VQFRVLALAVQCVLAWRVKVKLEQLVGVKGIDGVLIAFKLCGLRKAEETAWRVWTFNDMARVFYLDAAVFWSERRII